MMTLCHCLAIIPAPFIFAKDLGDRPVQVDGRERVGSKAA